MEINVICHLDEEFCVEAAATPTGDRLLKWYEGRSSSARLIEA
jgi:hypothetical protein